MATQSSGDPNQLQDFADSFYHRPHDPTINVPSGAAKPWPINDDGSWDITEEEPTITKPSLRHRRKVVSCCVIAFTIGALLIALSSPYSNEFLAPGPLHSSHAQLLGDQGADRCAACHTGATKSTFGWVAHAFSGAASDQTQSQLCLECHKSSMNESFALNPHNVAPAELKKRGPFQNASFVSSLKMPPVSGDNEIACSACHREHKGTQDLKAMTDSQCQSCHQSNYHSFESDHSEFTNWPKASRQKIAFDHATHSSKHFPGSSAAFDCNRCHIDDAWQNAKIQAPFEQACASCHEKKIVDSGVDGFALLSVPMLDMTAIENLGLEVGSWPLVATGDFDGPMPPAMRLLLMADPEVRPILLSKSDSFEFADLDPGVEGDVRDAVAIAWSIKKLVYELSRSGSTAVKRRLESVFDREIANAEVNAILNGMDDRSFAAAARRWFPKLDREVEARFDDSVRVGVVDKISKQNWLGRISSQDLLAENPFGGSDDDSKENLELIEGTDSNQSEQPLAASESLVKQQLVAIQQPKEATENDLGTPMALVEPQQPASLRTGWIRDDRRLQVVYRPSGHHDAFLKNWIDTVLSVPGVETNQDVFGLFHSLTEVNSMGNCRYCHTLKRNEDQSLVMNWKASRRDGSVSQFTSFSHRPHLVQPVLQDCSHCHKMDSSVSNKESFASLDHSAYRSNFHGIKKETCSTCHQKGLTDNSCTTCHNYHVGGQSKVNLIED